MTLFLTLLAACRPPGPKVAPTIEFTTVPKADQGGPETRALIEGRVMGGHPGQQIVLFARSGTGVWWVQPFANQAITTIQPDARWSNSTHLGTEYAALLVEPGYRPPSTLDALPSKSAIIAAVASAKGGGSARGVSRTLHFSGYEWEIRQVPSDRGGLLSTYDPANAWTDTNGWLHLRIAQGVGEWTCAEVSIARSLGYGSYSFVVQDSSQLEPAGVLGMFTWDDLGLDQNHREMDIEISRWGDPDSKNAQFVVQPFFVPANVVRFTLPSGRLTHSMRWQPGRASFQTVRPATLGAASSVVYEHVFSSGVPTPGGETVHINLYAFYNKRNHLRNPAEVVIEKFEYLP